MASSTTQFRLLFNKPDTSAHFSSDNISDVLVTGLTVSDGIATYLLRYPALTRDFNRMHGTPGTSSGTTLDFIHNQSCYGAGIIVTTAILGIAAYSSYLKYKDIKKSQKHASNKVLYQNVQTQLPLVSFLSPKPQSSSVTTKQFINYNYNKSDNIQPKRPYFTYNDASLKINRALNQALDNNPELKKDYKKVHVSPLFDLRLLPPNKDAKIEPGKLYLRVLDNGDIEYAVIAPDGKPEPVRVIVRTAEMKMDIPQIRKILASKKPDFHALEPLLGDLFKIVNLREHTLLRTTGWKVTLEKQPTPPAEPWWAFWRENWKTPTLIKETVKAADNTSNTLGLISYAYWIFFIGAAAVTGIFAVGMGAAAITLSLSTPLFVGLLYAGRKIYNRWWGNKHIKRQEQDDFNLLAEEALLEEEQREAIGPHKKPKPASQKIAIPAMTVGSIASATVLGGIGSYVSWQYNMWYVTDFINAIHLAKTGVAALCDVAASAIGIGIFVFAMVAAIRTTYAAYQDYKKTYEKNNPNEKLGTLDSLKIIGKSIGKTLLKVILLPYAAYAAYQTLYVQHRALLKKQKNVIETLEKKLAKLEKENSHISTPILDARLNQARESEAKSGRHGWVGKILRFLNFGMTGAFVARTVFVSGTGFLLPGLAAAVCLSTPWTAAILVVAGLVWGAYRYYNYRKEKNLKKLAQGNKRIEYLERKIHILEETRSDYFFTKDHDASIQGTKQKNLINRTYAKSPIDLKEGVQLGKLSVNDTKNTAASAIDEKGTSARNDTLALVKANVASSTNAASITTDTKHASNMDTKHTQNNTVSVTVTSSIDSAVGSNSSLFFPFPPRTIQTKPLVHSEGEAKHIDATSLLTDNSSEDPILFGKSLPAKNLLSKTLFDEKSINERMEKQDFRLDKFNKSIHSQALFDSPVVSQQKNSA